MSTSLKLFVVLAVLLMAPVAFAQPTIVNFDFGAVRILCSNGYAYESPTSYCWWDYPMQKYNSTPGFGWTLSLTNYFFSGAGLTGPNTIFSPPPFTGLPFNQAAYLQGKGSFVWQAVEGFTAGKYTLSLYLGSRYASGGFDDGNQTVMALIDDKVVGTWVLSSFAPFTLVTASFTVTTNGKHTVEFLGTKAGDHTAFLSYVTITPAQEKR
jgi:hypothetical protein